MKHDRPKLRTGAGSLMVLAVVVMAYFRNHAVLAGASVNHFIEMLAAVLLFCVGFAIVALATVILMDRILDRSLIWSEPYMARVTQRVERTWVELRWFAR